MKNKLTKGFAVVRENPQLKIGLIMLCALLLVALLAPVLAPYNPYFMSDELVEAPSGAIYGRGYGSARAHRCSSA